MHAEGSATTPGAVPADLESATPPPNQPRGPISSAFFLDVPYILDSALRHAEYRLNRLFNYERKADGTAELVLRPYWQQPPFWFLIATLLFVAFGPTFDAFCSVLGSSGTPLAHYAGIGLAWAAVALQTVTLVVRGYKRAARRFADQKVDSILRKVLVGLMLAVIIGVLAVPWITLARYLQINPAGAACVPDTARNPVLLQIGVFVAAVALVWVIGAKVTHAWYRNLFETLVMGAMALTLWNLVPEAQASESQQVPYKHLFAVVALMLALITWVTPVLAFLAFRSAKPEAEMWRNALKASELFPGSRQDPQISLRRVLGAAVMGILQYPLHLLLVPALVIVITRADWVHWSAYVSGAISLLTLTCANLTARWRAMLVFFDRWFLRGTPLIVSLLVIIFAVLRLAGFSYVSTVLDVAPFGVLALWILMAYSTFWWFESRVNAIAAATLLKILGCKDPPSQPKVKYEPDVDREGHKGTYTNTTRTLVDPQGRWLAAHGAGRFAVVGWFKSPHKEEITEGFYTYGLGELFENLRGVEPAAVHDIHRRVHLYFAGINVLIVAAALWLGTEFGTGDKQNTVHAVIQTQLADPAAQTIEISSLLLVKEGDAARPAIVVAASGGGTRAAMYAAAGIAGLGGLRRDGDITLLSGVSGGAVAAAYYYAHRADFLDENADKRKQAWERYVEQMGVPFISDVLEGASEWRIFRNDPLSKLLAESFRRRLFDPSGKAGLNGSPGLGLMLNTTITGHPLAYTALLGESFTTLQTPAGSACERQTRPLKNLAGGRLLFTNLKLEPDAWEDSRKELPDVRLPYVIVANPQVPIAEAAALAANFPPVFPNARVDLTNAKKPTACASSFYVTDGGVLENLGLVSALLAVRSGLDEITAARAVAVAKDGTAATQPAKLRDIHIVALEASAFGYDYSQDRGFDALGAGKERLTGALTLQLIRDVEARLKLLQSDASLKLHYLPLPTVFRSRGGFGTHWMAPASVKLQNPRTAYEDECEADKGPCSVELERPDLEVLWKRLFSVEADFCQTPRDKPGATDRESMRQVAAWICGDGADLRPDYFVTAWSELVTSLRQSSELNR